MAGTEAGSATRERLQQTLADGTTSVSMNPESKRQEASNPCTDGCGAVGAASDERPDATEGAQGQSASRNVACRSDVELLSTTEQLSVNKGRAQEAQTPPEPCTAEPAVPGPRPPESQSPAAGAKGEASPRQEPLWVQCDHCFKWRSGVVGAVTGGVCVRWCCTYGGRSCGDLCDWCKRAECGCKGKESYEGYETEGYHLPPGFWAVIRFRNSHAVPVGAPWLIYRSFCSTCGVASEGMDRAAKMEKWLARHRGCRREWKDLSLKDFDFRLGVFTRDVYRHYLHAVKGGIELSFADLLQALQPSKDLWAQGKWKRVREFVARTPMSLKTLMSADRPTQGKVRRPREKWWKVNKSAKLRELVGSSGNSVNDSAASAALLADEHCPPPVQVGVKHLSEMHNEQQAKRSRLEDLALAAEQEAQKDVSTGQPGPLILPAVSWPNLDKLPDPPSAAAVEVGPTSGNHTATAQTVPATEALITEPAMVEPLQERKTDLLLAAAPALSLSNLGEQPSPSFSAEGPESIIKRAQEFLRQNHQPPTGLNDEREVNSEHELGFYECRGS
eukprot:evm.model.scf_159.10 EVM.evm.TU.scf_159.10   scf_159:123055-125257(-)